MKRVFTPARKKTILIVDDDQVVIQVYREQFQKQRFEVEIASDAESALQTLKEGPVDLMILDLCLPGMNAVEVLQTIRSEFEASLLPIIGLTNAYLSTLARTAMESGATKCLVKTDVTPNQVLEQVRDLLTPGQSHPTVASETDGFQLELPLKEKLLATLLVNAPATLGKLRALHQVFARTEEENSRREELCELHRHIRKLGPSSGLLGLRKIAQMANALEALFIELQAKPQKITASVIRTIAQAIDLLGPLFDQVADSQNEDLAPPRILVVDDEVISRESICSALGKANLHAVSQDDPIAAQGLLEKDHFDLIFLDVEMPGLSGTKLCVNIREMETNRTTPVVFVTSRSDFGSRAQSTLSGGNDFIAKPFLSVELAVKALIWLFKESRPLLVSHEARPAPVAIPEGPVLETHAATCSHSV